MNEALRDRLVRSIRSENTQKRLLSSPELTLTKAVNITVAVETTTRDAEELQGTRLPPVSLSVFISCYRCRNSDHMCKYIPVVSNLKLAEDVESKGTSREYAVQSLKVQAHLANLPNVSTQRN